MEFSRRLLLIATFLLMARSVQPGTLEQTKPNASSAPEVRHDAADRSANEKWIADTLAKMTLDEKLGQMLVVYYFGALTSTQSPEYRELIRAVEQQHVGGFVIQTHPSPLGIERSQAYPTAALANQLQSLSKIPLIVAADFERGTAMRLDEGTSFPQAMAVGATGNPADAYTMGRITAMEARASGVQWIFAPVSDVNSNPANPIINTRSFGEDPHRVAEFVAAFVRGVEENGGLACAKHFPGHGDTSTDSHLDLPTLTADRARLESVELVPFKAAIAAGVGSVMTGHLAVPSIEPDANLPATLSPHITTDLLRKELGFHGVVVTDAMDMAGVAERYSPGEAAVRSIAAGTDVLLIPPSSDAALSALREAVDTGRIPLGRVNEAVTHILRAKAQLGLDRHRLVDLNNLNNVFATPDFAQAAADIAARGVTLLRDTQHLVPLDATRKSRVLLVAISGDSDAYPAPNLETQLRAHADSLSVIRVDTRFEPAASIELPKPESYDVAIAALFVRVADRKGSIGLPDDESALLGKLLANGKPVIVASFGSPYLIERFPAAQTWLAAFSTVDVAQTAIGRALFGETAIGGHLPVSIPGATPPLKIGDGMKSAATPMTLVRAPATRDAKLAAAYSLIEKAIADHAFPGGVLAVGLNDEISVKAFGHLTYEPKSAAVTDATIYDLASLTKPIVTATLAAQEVEAGRLKLDAPISVFLPEWSDGPDRATRSKVTIQHLLTHTAGLPAHVNYFESAKSKREIISRIVHEPLVYTPGAKSEYSDLDFILLGEIIERLTGRELDDLAEEQIFKPLGMRDTQFNPPENLRALIAPTEYDPTFRDRLLQGEVHDENTFAMGGVAGHAGLFSTAPDLAAFAQMMLNGGIYAHHRLLKRATVELFTSPQSLSNDARTLGWVVPTENSSSGHYFSPKSFGHTGFTGTSLWIDPEKHLFVILLTNRVHPTRANEKLPQLRPALHDAIMQGLGLTSGASSKPSS